VSTHSKLNQEALLERVVFSEVIRGGFALREARGKPLPIYGKLESCAEDAVAAEVTRGGEIQERGQGTGL